MSCILNLLICLVFLSQISLLCAQITTESPYSLQELNNSEFRNACQHYINDFCSHVDCEPIVECPNGVNRLIVSNVSGYDCCKECVTYLDANEKCEMENKTHICRYGLQCVNGSDGEPKCVLPDTKNRCLRERTNKKIITTEGTKLLIYGMGSTLTNKSPEYFQVRYATDIEYPSCDHSTGLYSLKQCRKSKCFCVNPNNGEYTFGLTENYKSENMTCECAHSGGDIAPKQCQTDICNCVNPNGSPLKSYIYDRSHGKESEMKCICALEEYYAEKENLAFQRLQCDAMGNFQPYQCFEGGRECFCVDEDGQRISEMASSDCLDNFIKTFDPRILKDDICKAMRKSLTEVDIISGKCYNFVREITSVNITECTGNPILRGVTMHKC